MHISLQLDALCACRSRVGTSNYWAYAPREGLGASGGRGVSAMTASVCSIRFDRFIAILTVLMLTGLAALALPVSAHATTYYVSVVGSDTAGTGTFAHPFASVQKALSEATRMADLVSVGPGTFSGDVTMTVAGVSLEGAGASLTTLRGDGLNSVIHLGNIGVGATISGFTITGGGGDYGGGIRCNFSSPTITGNVIMGNVAGLNGGGIECNSSSPTIRGNTIEGNRATSGSGGAVYCSSSFSATISGNTLSDNTAGASGGGIDCNGGSAPTISGNAIAGNKASYGGGIYCSSSSTPTITDNTIAGNTATSSGGGIECQASSLAIAGNTIARNSSTGNGGGIDCYYYSSPTITGNAIVSNDVGGNGGGISCNSSCSPTITGNVIDNNDAGTSGGGINCNFSSSPTITGNTMAGNTASNGAGGGICCANSSLPTITNDVIASNSGTFGGGIYLATVGSVVSNNTIAYNSAARFGGGVYSAGGDQPITNCIVWGNSLDDMSGCSATYSDFLVGPAGVGNLHDDPIFVDAPDGDYHLMAGSPCIDVATSTAAPATDRGGIARPWGAGFDMGAYEYYVATYHTTTSLTAPKSVKVKKLLTLAGMVSPTATSPYAARGSVTISMTRKVGKKWKSAGSAKVGLSGGAFTYSFKPKYKGSWHFVATYSGGVVSPTTYLPSTSAVKGVTVK